MIAENFKAYHARSNEIKTAELAKPATTVSWDPSIVVVRCSISAAISPSMLKVHGERCDMKRKLCECNAVPGD